MVKTTSTVRFAALSALVLGFAFAGFVVNASAASAPAATAGDPASASAPAATVAGPAGPAAPLPGADATGEGAMSSSPCYADMPVYNKEGRFLGRGLVNTCK